MSAELTLRSLRRHFAGTPAPAVADLDLTVPAGSCVALVGPSGSGKSTVLRLATGLERPDAGDVLLDGESVLALPPEERGMAMVFQRPLLFPHRNVVDNVAFAARVRGTSRPQARAQAREYLDLVHLGDHAGRRPHELSGGQQQRVAVARALAAHPRVLLLDEPFSALDAPLREEMHELVRQIREALDPTVVLVTHDQAEAAALADTVAVIGSGRLHQHDTVDRVYARPASLLVARQMGGRNEIPGVVRGHRHVSALGSVALPLDVGPTDGAGVLVVRQESVHVTDPDDADADVVGIVADVRPQGPRRLVTVRPDEHVAADGVRPDTELLLHAEAPPGHRVRAGDRVGLRFSPHALAVVPGKHESGVSGYPSENADPAPGGASSCPTPTSTSTSTRSARSPG